MFKYLSQLYKKKSRKKKDLNMIYRLVKNMNINQIKKGLIDKIVQLTSINVVPDICS